MVPVMTFAASCSRRPSTCSMICDGWVTNPMARVAAAITQAMSESHPRPVAAPPGVGDDGADGDGRGDQRPEHLIRQSLDGGVDLGGGVPVERQVQEPLEEQERPVQGEQRDPQQQIADDADDLVQRRRQPQPGLGGVVGLDRQRVRERAVRLEQRLLRVGVGGVGEQAVGVRHPRRTDREQAEQPGHRQQPPRPAQAGQQPPGHPPQPTEHGAEQPARDDRNGRSPRQ